MEMDIAGMLRDIRRDLHRIPEVGYDLPLTKKYLKDIFKSIGVQLSELGGGLVADIGSGMPRILLRADMDALPLNDGKNVPYRSTHDGACHACGHDGHMAMLFGAACLLQAEKSDQAVRLMLQPAEECPPGGALPMIQAGVLDGIESAYAIHLNPAMPCGSVGLKSGPVMAATDNFKLTVTGKSGHGALPHQAADAVVAAAHVVSSLQCIPSRLVDPVEPLVVTVGKIAGGTANNVIADKVVLEGTVRSLSEDMRQRIPDTIESVARQAAGAFGCGCLLEYNLGYPVLVNGEKCVDMARKAAEELVESDRVLKMRRPLMGGEDFSYVLKQVPGALLFLGSGSEAFSQSLHHPCFDFDEDVLLLGAKLFFALSCRNS